MHPFRLSLLVCLTLLLQSTETPAQESGPWFRFPALNSDGTKLAFGYQGDIWTADLSAGSTAQRLTIHESYELQAQWSLDDARLVFRGSRYGNYDLFSIPAGGGRSEQLTFHSTTEGMGKWDQNGVLYFSTRRIRQEVERDPEIYRLDTNNKTPYRFLDALGDMAAPSPDGKLIAFVRGGCRIEREHYQGPANRDIWLYNTVTDTYTQLTDFEGQDVYPDWGKNGQLYFLSAQNGWYNVYKLRLNADGSAAGDPVAVTTYTGEGVRYFDLSADGEQLVFERGIDLYLQAADGSGTARMLDIQVADDYRFDPIEQKTYTKSATEFALSPNGKQLAFVVRGEIFVTDNDKESKRTSRITKHPFRDQEVAWLNDSTLLFLSDRDGNSELYLARSADLDDSDLLRTLKKQVVRLTNTPEDEEAFSLSPDGARIAIRRGRGQLLLARIDSLGQLSAQRTLLDGWATPGGLSWSPDSRWLAYSLDDLDFNEEIFIASAEEALEPVNVSMHPRGDRMPVWSEDGSKLAFLSIRNNGDWDVWFAWLKKEDWEKTKSDWEEFEPKEEEDKKDKDKKKDDKKKVVEPIVIDLEGIHERLVQVTRLPGNESNLALSPDGETFYFTTNGSGRQGSSGDRALMKVKWDGSDMETLKEKADLSNLQVSEKGKRLYFLASGGSISSIGKDGKNSEARPFVAKMEINHPVERQQIFEEAWRSLKDGFYDPEFHGKDWQALRAKYEKRSINASTSQDFRSMFNEMLGQLDASHMGIYGSNPEETQSVTTGLIGVEVKPLDLGVRIQQVLHNAPADKEASKLSVGETILTVNGETVHAGQNFHALFNNLANERVLLEVQGADGVREVIIRPVSSLSTELYESWVHERRRLTEEYSNGRLGYLHIRGMNWPSFERFERDLMAAGYGKEGIVIDVRFNGGGWTTDMLMAVLNVQQHAYTVPRGSAPNLDNARYAFREHYPYGERLPLAAWTRPSIAMCNEASYSNAEIFSHAYKHLGIGTLVGMPTFGAVISTGGQGLIDGSFVRMPFRAWFVKATDENMEHGPAVPDILVPEVPGHKAKGIDDQLKKAVEVLLQQIDG